MAHEKHGHNKKVNKQTLGSGNEYHETHAINAPGYGENRDLAESQVNQDSSKNH